ncbi:hypothetical protein GMRT_13941 [Giardia muris]|uniref:Uncharacterized protein n=1 Tax=Giardia muris TaxID=5742 RepID=A0A4Z1SNL7_GIAMU|nr:hypothetical protein GMRT_13941 [Giardia muris]|eukprot:TNJ26475.1 hypothetical protein GMRT_13941 [Giardia muris]
MSSSVPPSSGEREDGLNPRRIYDFFGISFVDSPKDLEVQGEKGTKVRDNTQILTEAQLLTRLTLAAKRLDYGLLCSMLSQSLSERVTIHGLLLYLSAAATNFNVGDERNVLGALYLLLHMVRDGSLLAQSYGSEDDRSFFNRTCGSLAQLTDAMNTTKEIFYALFSLLVRHNTPGSSEGQQLALIASNLHRDACIGKELHATTDLAMLACMAPSHEQGVAPKPITPVVLDIDNGPAKDFYTRLMSDWIFRAQFLYRFYVADGKESIESITDIERFRSDPFSDLEIPEMHPGDVRQAGDDNFEKGQRYRPKAKQVAYLRILIAYAQDASTYRLVLPVMAKLGGGISKDIQYLFMRVRYFVGLQALAEGDVEVAYQCLGSLISKRGGKQKHFGLQPELLTYELGMETPWLNSSLLRTGFYVSFILARLPLSASDLGNGIEHTAYTRVLTMLEDCDSLTDSTVYPALILKELTRQAVDEACRTYGRCQHLFGLRQLRQDYASNIVSAMRQTALRLWLADNRDFVSDIPSSELQEMFSLPSESIASIVTSLGFARVADGLVIMACSS